MRKKTLLLLVMVPFLNFTEKSFAGKSKKMSSAIQIVFISDTHGRHNEIDVPDGDILVFCGDMCPRGELADVQAFSLFLKKLTHKHKVVIAGNHDAPFEDERRHLVEEMIRSSGAIYLNDSGVEIEQIKIWGSPVTPEFNNWSFNRKRGEEIKRHWDRIPLNTELLITHGPPYGILDKTIFGEKVGCRDLFQKTKEVKPKAHAFGHVHEGYGKIKKHGITFINASNLNARYQYTNPPIVLNWKF